MKIQDAQAAVYNEWSKLRNLPVWDHNKEKCRSGSTSENDRIPVHFCIRHRPLPLEACGICETPPEQWKSRALGGQRQGRQRILSSSHGPKRIAFSSGSRKISGYNVQTSQYGR